MPDSPTGGAKRYYGMSSSVSGSVRLADSRQVEAVQPEQPDGRFKWVITSPPYYHMRSYIPDRWLRNWFVSENDHRTDNEGRFGYAGDGGHQRQHRVHHICAVRKAHVQRERQSPPIGRVPAPGREMRLNRGERLHAIHVGQEDIFDVILRRA